jgi:hypothetical protein
VSLRGPKLCAVSQGLAVLALERSLQDRYPHWFAGRRSRLVRPLLRGLQKWSGLDALDAFLDASHELHGFALVQAGMDFLQARYVVAPTPAACIPARGRLLIVANHPSGARDALALLDCVGQVRRDVKIVANDFLWALEGLRELLLPAVAKAPFAQREFGSTYWQTRADEYADLLGKTDGLTGKVSKSVSQKDTAKLELRKVLQAVVYALKANFPDTFEAELRAWGFLKESY